MDRSVVIYLISNSQSQDSLGIWQDQTTERKVYAQKMSITQTEWFEGGRAGLNPAFMFKMFSGDYNGESMLKYDGTTYTIYRTYLDKNEAIELYTELRKGNENARHHPGAPEQNPPELR